MRKKCESLCFGCVKRPGKGTRLKGISTMKKGELIDGMPTGR